MYFSRGTLFKVVLPLVIALGFFSCPEAEAADPTPIPPTSKEIQLNTYGVLPVTILNLTQSPINFDVSTTSANGYTSVSPGLPIAAGLSGVYYPSGSGSTTTFTNIYAPATPVNGTTSASLMPVATEAPNTPGTYTYSTQLNFMNMFTLFPSWTNAAKFNYVEYVALSDVKNQGAAAYDYGVVAGYPTAHEEKNAITKSDNYTSAKAHNAALPSTASINLSLLSNNVPQAVYKINVNSLGAGTPSFLPRPSHPTMLSILNDTLSIIGDVMVIVDPDDVFYKFSMIVGGLSSLQSMQAAGVTTNVPPYTAKAKGVNVSATASFNDGQNGTFSLYEGDVDSLTYQVLPATVPLIQQNHVLITTWRQTPYNTSSLERNSTDMLLVSVINEGVYAAHQTSQYLSQVTGVSASKPTREQAQNAAKFLGVLTNMTKEQPQEAGYILEVFGLHGKYKELQNDPVAVRNLHIRLMEILRKYDLVKHPNDRPFIQQCLAVIENKQ